MIREYSAQEATLPVSVLLNTALGGGVYARVLDIQVRGIEALSWSNMMAYAHRIVAPSHMLLVLVGDFVPAEIAPCLGRTFGTLPAIEDELEKGGPLMELGDGTGARRLQAHVPQAQVSQTPLILMAWRVPPMAHADTPALQIVAQILGGGSSSRLARRLMGAQSMAKSISVHLGVPGGRETSLLIIEVEPAAEHPLVELEQAIMSEVMTLQQGMIPQDEIRKAQRQLEANQTMLQEDSTQLAEALGAAQCQGGDWRLAFRELVRNRDFQPDEIRTVVQRYLVPAQVTSVLLEPDPLLAPEDRQEARLVKLLTQVLQSRVKDPARLEAVVRETLRQLRMVPGSERDRILKILEAQVKP
jgi:zinc protease